MSSSGTLRPLLRQECKYVPETYHRILQYCFGTLVQFICTAHKLNWKQNQTHQGWDDVLGLWLSSLPNDVTFQQECRTWGSVAKWKKHFPGDQKLQRYRVEVSLVSIGLDTVRIMRCTEAITDVKIVCQNVRLCSEASLKYVREPDCNVKAFFEDQKMTFGPFPTTKAIEVSVFCSASHLLFEHPSVVILEVISRDLIERHSQLASSPRTTSGVCKVSGSLYHGAFTGAVSVMAFCFCSVQLWKAVKCAVGHWAKFTALIPLVRAVSSPSFASEAEKIDLRSREMQLAVFNVWWALAVVVYVMAAITIIEECSLASEQDHNCFLILLLRRFYLINS